MCLSTDEKYTELIEAINPLDRKEDIIELQNKETDDRSYDIIFFFILNFYNILFTV